MSKPKYRWAHQQERARWVPVVDAGEAYCAQPLCLMRTRWIAPGTPWALGHDATGTVTIGPVHKRCNDSDGAVRGNRQRGRQGRRRQAAPPPPSVERDPQAGRWVL